MYFDIYIEIVSLRARRALLLYKVYDNNALLVLSDEFENHPEKSKLQLCLTHVYIAYDEIEVCNFTYYLFLYSHVSMINNYSLLIVSWLDNNHWLINLVILVSIIIYIYFSQ